MKTYIRPFISLLIILFQGCSNWLDVSPLTEVQEKELFTTEAGFQDALIGVYIDMKNADAYGENLTVTTLEYLAQHWQAPYSNKEEFYLKTYDYTNILVEERFSTIYAKLYHIVALANNILAHVDNQQHLFKGGTYELIKGEALGIRAYVHFDLLRLFGPIPSRIDPAKRILPYVRSLSRQPNSHETYENYCTFLENDIQQALEYLKKVDPILKYSNTNNEYGIDPNFKPENDIWYYRSNRINYYTLKGLLARLYLWNGETRKAFTEAKEVIETQNADGSLKFPLGDKSSLESGNLTLKYEHLFGLHIYNLKTYSDKWSEGNAPLSQPATEVNNDVFESFTTDARKIYLWNEYTDEVGGKHNVCLKYNQSKNTTQLIPLLRISELYLIATETAPTLDKGEYYFNQLRLNRDITSVTFQNEIHRQQEVMKEYRKEFYAEGQMFYTYKRLGIENILWTTLKGSETVYVLPLPKKEINYIK